MQIKCKMYRAGAGALQALHEHLLLLFPVEESCGASLGKSLDVILVLDVCLKAHECAFHT